MKQRIGVLRIVNFRKREVGSITQGAGWVDIDSLAACWLGDSVGLRIGAVLCAFWVEVDIIKALCLSASATLITLVVLQATTQHLDGIVEHAVHAARVYLDARVNGTARPLKIDLCDDGRRCVCKRAMHVDIPARHPFQLA